MGQLLVPMGPRQAPTARISQKTKAISNTLVAFFVRISMFDQNAL